jgi:Glycerate kinase family
MLSTDPLLVVSGPFGPGLPASRVAAAIGRGLQAGGLPEPDLCPLELERESPRLRREEPGDSGRLLDALDLDARMRHARAVVLATRRLTQRTLSGSATFEIATRARQAGVPAYAVTGENGLERFDARMLDLQLILQARGARALAAAGRRLARLV